MSVAMVYRTETGRVPMAHLDRQPIDVPPEDVTPVNSDAVPLAFLTHAQEMYELERLSEKWGTLGHHLEFGEIEYVYYVARVVDDEIEFGLENMEVE